MRHSYNQLSYYSVYGKNNTSWPCLLIYPWLKASWQKSPPPLKETFQPWILVSVCRVLLLERQKGVPTISLFTKLIDKRLY